ncbi:MAG: hypothetical protein AAGK78_11740, partial [Planctomycetota bacterium]
KQLIVVRDVPKDRADHSAQLLVTNPKAGVVSLRKLGGVRVIPLAGVTKLEWQPMVGQLHIQFEPGGIEVGKRKQSFDILDRSIGNEIYATLKERLRGKETSKPEPIWSSVKTPLQAAGFMVVVGAVGFVLALIDENGGLDEEQTSVRRKGRLFLGIIRMLSSMFGAIGSTMTAFIFGGLAMALAAFVFMRVVNRPRALMLEVRSAARQRSTVPPPVRI